MSATFPIVTFGLVLSAFISVSPAEVTKPQTNKLVCEYSGSYFRVTDGLQKWEKYIANWDNKLAKIECGEKVAGALIGSYFVFFANGQIKDKYIGSFAEDRRILVLEGDLIAAIDGGYFITAKAGGDILDHFSGSTSEKPAIAINKNFAAAAIGSYFVVSDGNKVDEKLVGGSADSKIIATPDMAAALMGSYFVGYSKGVIRDKYIGGRENTDTLVAGQNIIAASMGEYFVVLDNQRGVIKEKFTGAPGKVRTTRSSAVYEQDDGTTTRYNMDLGEFTDQ